MPVLKEWNIQIDVDRILTAQGADPAVIRARNPNLVAVTERALAEGLPLIEPVVAYRQLKIKKVNHERLILSEDGTLSGKTIGRVLAPAQQVVVMVCTIGSLLENFSSAVLPTDPVYGLALDSLGSAAVETLVVSACAYFGNQAAALGMQATIPLNPGMEGWPAERGQMEIFKLLDPAEAGVRLTPSGMMIPQKSLSLVIGLGEEVGSQGRVCDYCSLRATCRYQDQYA